MLEGLTSRVHGFFIHIPEALQGPPIASITTRSGRPAYRELSGHEVPDAPLEQVTILSVKSRVVCSAT
jgi:hypothetical protein